MSLIIQIPQAGPSSNPKFYRDPLVDAGTILAFDFSNSGALLGETLANGAFVYNLARDNGVAGSNLQYGVVDDPNGSIALSSGSGFDFSSLDGATTTQRGIEFQAYLRDWFNTNYASVEDLVAIYWIRVTVSSLTAAADAVYQRGTIGGTDASLVRLLANTSAGDGRVGIGAGGRVHYFDDWDQNELTQWAVHWNSAAGDIQCYKNGVAISPDSSAGTMLSAYGPISDSQNGLIGCTTANEPPFYLYRFLLENIADSDLSVSEFIAKDYDYVLGQNDFSHVAARGYVATA